MCGGRRNIFCTLNFDVSLCFIISAITPSLQYRVFCLTPKNIDGKAPTKLKFAGGWLLTSPEDEILQPTEPMPDIVIDPDPPSTGARSAVTHLVHQEFLDYLIAMHVYHLLCSQTHQFVSKELFRHTVPLTPPPHMLYPQ